MREESKEKGRPWPTLWSGAHIGGEQYQAMIADQKASVEFKLDWIEKGWHEEPSSVIRDVLYNENGRLSGTTRLVEGPQRLVAEIYFEPGAKPRIVARYKGELPKGFYADGLVKSSDE